MGAQAVNVANIPQTRALLARFEPDLLKRLDGRLNVIARRLKAAAQSNLAATGVTGTAYRVRTRARVGRFSKSVIASGGGYTETHWGDTPGVLAAVFEFANGVRDSMPQNVPRTKSLIATLNAKYGQPGRFLWAAWDEQKVASLAAVESEIKAVEAEYTARMR
jgi:hypothetical protein